MLQALLSRVASRTMAIHTAASRQEGTALPVLRRRSVAMVRTSFSLVHGFEHPSSDLFTVATGSRSNDAFELASTHRLRI